MTREQLGTLAVMGSSMAIFWPGALIFGYPGVMGHQWQQMFGVGKGAIGDCLFFVLAMVGIFMFTAGKLQERFGTRVMIRLGVIICSLSVLVAAYATNIYMIYLWAILNGVASSLVYIPGLTTVQKWFPERKGLASGLVNLSFGVSAAIMAPIFRYLLTSIGYNTMNLVVAVVALLTGLIAAHFTEVPERILPGERESMQASPAPALRIVSPSMTVAEAAHTKNFWLLWTTWAFQGAASVSMVTLSVAFGMYSGFSFAEAVLILTSFNLTNGLSRIIAGYLSDFVERRILMSITFVASGIAYLLIPWVSSLTMLCLLAMIIGFGFGSLFACSAPLAIDCFGIKHFGAIFGLVFTAYGFISGVIGPSLGGYMIDLTGGNYSIVFTYLGFLSLISGVIVSFVLPPASAPDSVAVSS